MHGATGMSRVGRKRVVVVRTAGGRATEAGREREFPPTQVKRLRDAAMAGLRDPEWGTELGRLYLDNAITAVMYAAGKRWREWAADHHRAIGAAAVHSTSPEPGRGAQQPDPDTTEGQRIARKEAKARENYLKAHDALVACGAGVRIAVRRVCEDDMMVQGHGEFLLVRIGLMALATHWNLTANGKSDSRRNAT